MENWQGERRPCGRSGAVQNGVTAASHAILHDLIGLRAGIGTGGAPIAAVATSRRNDTDSRTLFGRFRPGTTADCASSCTDCGASYSGARYSFTLRRIRLVLHSEALTLLQIHLVLRVVLYLRHIDHYVRGQRSVSAQQRDESQ